MRSAADVDACWCSQLNKPGERFRSSLGSVVTIYYLPNHDFQCYQEPLLRCDCRPGDSQATFIRHLRDEWPWRSSDDTALETPTTLCSCGQWLDPPRLFEFFLPECTPIASRSKKYTPEDAKFIESEVQRLLAADIIEPAPSPWRAQVLVVHQGPKKRLVIDYSTTINRYMLDAYTLPNIEDLVNTVAQARCYSSLDLRSAYHQIPLLEEERFTRLL